MGLLLGLLLIGGVCAGSAISTSSKQNKMLARYNDQHEGQIYWGTTYASTQSSINYQKVYNDWLGEKTMFPEEFIKYFELNPTVRGHYIWYLAQQLDWKMGICGEPKDYFRATKEQFSPGGIYGRKIKIFNETGEFYY